ncbi:MAG TPA: response regulator [Caulobacteraceae bacterium]|jgi:CheY-like chemotaxis protein|nr:response regulator [Caulobacteraceae bacterium]
MTFSPAADLANRRVLVVEDEALVSMLLEDMLDDLGCQVIGQLTRVDEALAFVAEHGQEIDVAILDVNLGGERSLKVAAMLRAAGTPFVLSTGYDDFSGEDEWRGGAILHKPFLASQLEAVLREALGLEAAP